MQLRLFIVAAKRTAFGAFGGKLKGLTATELAVHSTRAALAAGNVPPEIVNSVTVGNVQQTSGDAAYLARHVALKAGMAESTPALNINRLCGSGFQAVVTAAQEILLGECEVAVAAGTESMSQAPMSAYGHEVRFGSRLGVNLQLRDTLWAGLTDSHAGCPMGVTAENLASDYSISRAASDEYALSSQSRWKAAQQAGKFAAEIAPLELKGKKGVEVFDIDEHPRETTLEKMGKLPTTFKKDGVVSAASASGICDGAATLVVASEAAVAKHKLTPLCEVVSWASVGVDPTRMGIGPVPAIGAALGKTGMSLAQMDRVEINEAFAPQVLACAQALDLDMPKLNVRPPAPSVRWSAPCARLEGVPLCERAGVPPSEHRARLNPPSVAFPVHRSTEAPSRWATPSGASGARITAHLAHAIANGEIKTAVGAACIGGGQGIAIVLRAA